MALAQSVQPVANFGSGGKKSSSSTSPAKKRGRPPGSGKKNKGGGNNLPVLPTVAEVSHMRCKICKSPFRREVDSLLATGWSQVAVARHFNQIMPNPAEHFSPQNMSNHARAHLTSRDSAVRRIYEERARQMGVDTEAAENFILTRAAVLDTIIQQGLTSLHQGSTQAEPKEVIAAIQMLDKMEAEWKETAIDELMSEFKLFMEAVKDVVGEDMYSSIYERFEAKLDGKELPLLNPAPADVVEKKAEQSRDEVKARTDFIEAEIVDEEETD